MTAGASTRVPLLTLTAGAPLPVVVAVLTALDGLPNAYAIRIEGQPDGSSLVTMRSYAKDQDP